MTNKKRLHEREISLLCKGDMTLLGRYHYIVICLHLDKGFVTLSQEQNTLCKTNSISN